MLDFAEASGYYGLFAFLPLVVLPALHLAPSQLPLFYLAGSIGALFGGLAAAMLLDRWGRFATVASFYLATALGTIALAFATNLGALVLGGRVRAAEPAGDRQLDRRLSGDFGTVPISLRASGIGASVAVGRIGAMMSPFLVGAVGARSMPAALLLLAGFWVLGAAAMPAWRWLGGIEAKGLQLERIAPQEDAARA